LIREANKEVTATLTKQKKPKQRGPYNTQTISDDQRLKVAKYASIYGVVGAVRRYKKEEPGVTLRQSTVRTWRTTYHTELKKRTQEETQGLVTVESFPSKKRGRPLLLGEELDEQVKAYIGNQSP
jgi:hypothetical protein